MLYVCFLGWANLCFGNVNADCVRAAIAPTSAGQLAPVNSTSSNLENTLNSIASLETRIQEIVNGGPRTIRTELPRILAEVSDEQNSPWQLVERIISQRETDPESFELYETSNLDNLLTQALAQLPLDQQATVRRVLNRESRAVTSIDPHNSTGSIVFPFRAPGSHSYNVELDPLGESAWQETIIRKDIKTITNRLPMVINNLSTDPFNGSGPLKSKVIVIGRATSSGSGDNYVRRLYASVPPQTNIYQSYVNSGGGLVMRIFWYPDGNTIRIVGIREHL